MSINKTVISGNLTRDAELKTTPSGTSVLGFGVAVNDRRKNAQGEWEDVPNFIDCSLFGNRASALAQYLTKGTKVAVEGHLHWRQWDKDGEKRSKVDVIVDEVEFMSRREDGLSPAPQRRSTAPAPQERQQPADAYTDDDIPF